MVFKTPEFFETNYINRSRKPGYSELIDFLTLAPILSKLQGLKIRSRRRTD
jgi:hypothetical protein